MGAAPRPTEPPPPVAPLVTLTLRCVKWCPVPEGPEGQGEHGGAAGRPWPPRLAMTCVEATLLGQVVRVVFVSAVDQSGAVFGRPPGGALIPSNSIKYLRKHA